MEQWRNEDNISNVVKVNLPTNNRNIPEMNNPCIATVAVKDMPLFSGGPVLVKPSRVGQFLLKYLYVHL